MEGQDLAMGTKILFQNRPNCFTQRGGDTSLMERLAEELTKRGYQIDYDFSPNARPEDYALVHLFNFATPEISEHHARKAVAAGVPFVVTTLYEDWPLFFNKMHLFAEVMLAYVTHGQKEEHWLELRAAIAQAESRAPANNQFAASNAAALFVTGEAEATALRRDYGQGAEEMSGRLNAASPALKIHTAYLGCEISETEASPELFISEYGISDFILCVGRLEARKNQLLLLKALEDVDLPLVFACGDFAYDERYAAACRSFKRKGQTIFLKQLSAEMLCSAFTAAKVHALPSWYELPGLVSIEAARYGCNVVASDYGTARDYLGSSAFYCAPDNPEDIKNAVLAAFHSENSPSLKKAVQRFTWSEHAAEVEQVYRQILS